jgi:hypothetical protein
LCTQPPGFAVFGYRSLFDHVSQMSGSRWDEHELLRSVHIPVDHGADDEFAGFDSKEEVMVAPMDRLARGTRETQGALVHEAGIKREAADLEEDTQGVAGAPCSFAERARGDTDGYDACYICRKLHPTFASTSHHPRAAAPVPRPRCAAYHHASSATWTRKACLLTTKDPPILAPIAAGAAGVRVRLASGRAMRAKGVLQPNHIKRQQRRQQL